jgi:hypothetical protein
MQDRGERKGYAKNARDYSLHPLRDFPLRTLRLNVLLCEFVTAS